MSAPTTGVVRNNTTTVLNSSQSQATVVGENTQQRLGAGEHLQGRKRFVRGDSSGKEIVSGSADGVNH